MGAYVIGNNLLHYNAVVKKNPQVLQVKKWETGTLRIIEMKSKMSELLGVISIF